MGYFATRIMEGVIVSVIATIVVSKIKEYEAMKRGDVQTRG